MTLYWRFVISIEVSSKISRSVPRWSDSSHSISVHPERRARLAPLNTCPTQLPFPPSNSSGARRVSPLSFLSGWFMAFSSVAYPPKFGSWNVKIQVWEFWEVPFLFQEILNFQDYLWLHSEPPKVQKSKLKSDFFSRPCISLSYHEGIKAPLASLCL